MLLLTTAAHPTILEYRAAYPQAARSLGRLLTPRHYPTAQATADAGIPWAADNDGFNGVDFDAFKRMVDTLAGLPGCRFVTAPDVYADRDRTLAHFDEWAPFIAARDLPVALVMQDGMTPADVPFDRLDALFIGGTDRYKLGPEAVEVLDAARAQARPPWIHMGRVNSFRRIAYAAELGCDSVDGSKYSRWRRTRLPDGLRAVASAGDARPVALTA